MVTTRKLWVCGNCDRWVNAFVNGPTCPTCGYRRGREGPQ